MTGMDHIALGPGREFDLVRRFLRLWGERAQGVGDDAAVLAISEGAQLVATTDGAVDGVHFRRDWFSAEEIGYRTAVGALSDIAAMGARPLGILLSLTVPEQLLGELDGLVRGIGDAAERWATAVVGGDLTRGTELNLAYTVLGETSRPVRRSGARVGDAVYVTGELGGPLAALQALYSGAEPRAAHRARLVRPEARIREGQWLAANGATAMIDISDGLASEARHLAAASNAVIEIELERLPCIEGVAPGEAARSGEEYELLLTAPPDLETEIFRTRFGVPLARIGRVSAAGRGDALFLLHGARVDLGSGYDHFSA